MGQKHISAYRGAGLKANRVTKKEKKEHVSAYAAAVKNRGGVAGGIGYIAKRAGIDFLRVGEGVVDAALVPVDLLTGNVDRAKSRFLDSPVDAMRERLDEEYNPGKVAGFIGDIAGGIGQSVGYGLISAIPYAGQPMMYSSIVEQSISSAAEKTGEVGWKEVGYGATAGAVEGLLESKLGAGVNAVKGIGSAILKKTGINVAESAAKAGGKSMLKSVLTETAKGAAGEFAEEAISEAVDPALLRLYNIDENAQFSLKDVAYAGLIGGLSGGMMSAGPAAINYRSAVSVGRALQESRLDGDLINRAKYTLSALEAAQTRSTGQIKGKPEGDAKETAKEWLSRTSENRKVKRLSKETAQLADKIRRNIQAYENGMKDPAMAQSEPVAAILGELRGNLFLVGYAYEADVIEQVMMEADDKQRQAFVDAINEELAAQGKKHDYTLADFDANKDDIRRGLAGRLMMDELQGNTAEGGTEYGAEATEKPVEPAQAPKDTTAEQVDTQEENAATEDLSGIEEEVWRAVTDETVKGYGTQNEQEVALLRAAVSQNVPEKSIPLMLERFREGTDMTPAEFADAWADGVLLFGRLGLNEETISQESALSRMSEKARHASIEYGKWLSEEQRSKEQEAAKKKKRPVKEGESRKPKGEVVRHPGINLKADLDDAQFTAYKAAEIMAPALNADIEIHKGLKRDGKEVNGYYDLKTNTIHININAVRDGKHIALYTLGHEVTHYIKEWSPKKFYELGEYVMDQLGEGAEQAIRDKLDFLKRNDLVKGLDETEAYDRAYEEVVADGMELVLTDGTVLNELARENKTLWQKIKDRIFEIIEKIKKAYGDLSKTSRTAQILSETMDSLDEIEQLFYEGVTEAGERTRTAEAGVIVDDASGTAMLSVDDIPKTERRTTDTAYLAAVERGDMVTAQKMVDEAAKAAGYKIKAYHGTNAEFTVFDKNRVGKGIDQYGAGFYFASNADVTERYGNRKYDVYLSLKKPIRLLSKARGEGKSLYDVKITQTQAYKILKKHPMMYDPEESPLGDFYDDYWEVGPKEWMIKDLAKQYTNIGDLDADVILYRNYPNELHEAIKEVIGYDGVEVYFESDAMVDERNDYFYVAWFDNQMKSADPVTYDDNGNVIPLSERFKEDDSDIRYSIDETPETPDVSDSPFDEALRRAGLSHLVEETAEAETTETAPPTRKAPRERDPEEVRRDRIRAHETLANALIEAAQNEHEFRLVKNYREKAAELADAEVRKEDLRKKTAEVNREIDALQDKLKGVDKTKREPWVMTALTDAQKRKGELLDEMDALDEKLRTETDKLLSLASAKQLRKLIRAERSKAAAMERSAERARQREMDGKEWAKETVKKAREESEEKVKKARQEAQDYKAAVYKTSMEKVYKARREATDYKQAVYRTAYAKADEKSQKYRDRLDEMAKQSMERREITIRMREARRVLGYLNTMLYHPTKQKHVPESLQALVDKTLRSADPKQFGINRDHIREMSELAGKIRKLESKAGRTTAEQETLDKMKTKYEKLEAETISVKRQAEALMTAFEQYVTSTTDGEQIDKNMLEGLRQTVTEIEEAPLNEMTLESLKAVEKIYTVIYHQVNTANQAFATEKAANIDEMSTEANTQVKEAKELKFLSPRSREWAALAGVRSFLWKNMKPLTVFEAIGSDKLMEIFRRVLDAEDVWITDILEAKKALDEAKKKYGYNKWNLKERREVTTADGSKVSLTLGEMMSLYAYMFREQAEEHLSVGGFVFAPDAKTIEKFKGSKALYETHLNDQTTHRMRKQDIDKMSEMLTEEQRAYAKTVQEYLTSLGKKGNEVSRKLYGIDLFKETAYFPITSSHDYIETQTGKSGDPNIKSRGTFKETVPKAGNPIVLQDFMEVVGDHVNTMAIYHAFVLPVEDLTRVWNYTPVNIKRDENGKAILDKNGMPVADTEGEAGYNSLKAEITKKYGKEANDYILQLLRDLNGGARRESAASILDKGLTAFKRSATMLSLSTIVQQPTSILRAMAYVDAKHFTGASFVPWETVKKYAPVAAIKEVGGHDTNTGARTVDYINAKQYDSIKDAAKAAVTPEIYGGDPNVRAEAFGWLTGKADEVSWRYMFGAIVNEQAEKLGKPKDSEEVLKAAGKRFAEVVRRTQVYDSTLTRSEYMRSKDGLMKMATAFGAEPTTVVSMAVDAIIKAERGDKTFLRKSAAGIAFSIIANAAVASLIYAMRDDDEDETIPEKYVQSLTSELIEGFNPLEYLPIARDIMSMFKGYEIERSDMALIGNLMEQVELITSSKRSVQDKIFGVTGAVSAFFGLPVTNVYRDLKGLWKTGQSFTDAEEQTGAGLGHAMGDAVRGQFNLFSKLFGAESGNAYELYTAYVRGDTAHYERVKARYKTPQAAEMALRTELRDNDKRISEAAEAKHTGDLAVYESIVDQIESEGIFDRNIVIRAVNNEVSELKRAAEKDNLVPKDETVTDEETTESLYTASDLNAALERGDNEDFAAIMAALVKDKVSTGKTEAQAKSSVKSSVTSYWKKQYLSGYQDTETRKRIIAILTETGLYGSRNDVATMCEGWVKASK